MPCLKLNVKEFTLFTSHGILNEVNTGFKETEVTPSYPRSLPVIFYKITPDINSAELNKDSPVCGVAKSL